MVIFMFSIHTTYVLVSVVLSFAVLTLASCPRDRSRTVREVVIKDVKPLYEEESTTMPRSCPLHLERDHYGVHEDHKSQQTATHWICLLCGKAFYEQRFLDMHYDNRHAEHTRQGGDSLCLADYCDIFRCDVLTGAHKPEFWDLKLCKEEDLKQLKDRCEVLLAEHCLPVFLRGEERQIFLERLKSTICGFLTCDKYWEVPGKKDPGFHLVFFIVAAMILVLGLMIYYYVAYTHFYTDESLVEQIREERNAHYVSRPRVPANTDIRYRTSLGHR